MRIKIDGNVQAAKPLHRIPPSYPEDARHNRVAGTVNLHTIIAKDGSIKELEVVSGDSSLAASAIAAARQWRYQPTLLNGQPVEVDPQVVVVFQLNHYGWLMEYREPKMAVLRASSKHKPAATSGGPVFLQRLLLHDFRFDNYIQYVEGR